MFYNRISRVWVADPFDYFLISAIIGSLLASHLQNYLAEKAAMERLKKSIIDKSIPSTSKLPILESKKSKISRVYRFALNNRGGTLEDFKNDLEVSNEVMKLSQAIQKMVEQLAAFLKEREMKGALKIFFRHGRLILELILFRCNINMSYAVLTEGLSTQVTVFTATAGGALGFTLSWFSVGAALVAPPLLISTLLLRSATQQILNLKEYSKFKEMVTKILNEDDLKETLQEIFLEGKGPVGGPSRVQMGSTDFDKNLTLKHDFSVGSNEEFDKFIKESLQEKFGLVENPTKTQLEEIIQRKVSRKSKGKTVYFRDFIKEIPKSESDFDIIDAEIMTEQLQGILDNKL